MRVLLLKDVHGLGRAGDIKEVAGGYAQNYLLPRKLATPVTAGTVRQVQELKETAERKQERKVNETTILAAKLDGKAVSFRARAGEGDRLYGSITSADIAQELGKLVGVEVDRRFIELEHPLKALGEHRVTIKFGAGAVATVYVRVERSREVA
jgi:large subunit ribosomal protein L9